MTWKTCLSSIAATALVACGGSSGGDSSGGGATLTLTATPAALVANGVNASIIRVEGSQKGPIFVRTDRGTFLETGTNTASNNATPFDVTLVTCNSQVILIGCAGNAQVSASDQNLASARIQVRFVGVELCANGADDDGDLLSDCADPDCATQVCGANGLVCRPTSPSTCACPSGQTNETDAQCRSATPDDNDCDGKAGCNDTDCTGKLCPTTTQVGGQTVFGTCKLSGTVGTCTCVPSGGTTEAACSDGLDNDCDGRIDCEDSNCQGAGGLPGKACDATRPGLTCSDPNAPGAGNVSTCSVCAPNNSFAAAQPTETTCNDAVDNDCDGQTDCGDGECVSRAAFCGTKGERCTAALQCRCPDLSGAETACDDGNDNDCDGYVDCKDLNCSTRACGLFGKTCSTTANGTGSCVCPGGTAETCNDGIDNNCDGLADCADPTCRPANVSVVGKDCATGYPANGGAKCDFVGQCVCPGGQGAETSCSDNKDNDCDGLTDCADTDCLGRSCGTFGLACTATSPAGCTCPGGTPESGALCRDNVDNNCNGLVDCADSGCQGSPGAQCGPNAVQQCTLVTGSWVCKDTSTNYVLSVVATSPRLAANGIAQTSVIATLKDGSLVAVNNASIAFSTNLGTIIGSPVNTTPTGQASVQFLAPVSSGSAVVTADYTTPTLAHVTATATITLPRLGEVNLVNQQYAVLGAKGSGFQESSELTFQLVDTVKQTYPAGLTVTFEHTQLGGSYIGDSVANCAANVCTTSGVTDSAGKVKVILHSGSIANVVSVIARAQAGGSSVIPAVAGNIAIVGAKATGAEFVMDCSPKNIPALTNQDCTNSNYAGSDSKITCTVTLADRFKNKLGVATVVSFLTEAGTAGPPASTPAYDTTKAPGAQPNLGRTSNLIDAFGGKLPADVAPFAGEKSHTIALDACTSRVIRNPRDGLVTVIASVRGEEGFVDVNGNGAYDLGEPFIDQAEPFVDYNDNGLRESNEPFIDANNNGAWDGPNGVWDSDTNIWAQTRVLYTGYVFPPTFSGGEVGSRFFDAGVPPDPTATASFSVAAAVTGPPAIPATSDSVFLFFTDGNYNLPNYKYTFAVSKAPSASKATVAFAVGGIPTTLDDLGMNFTLQYCSVQVPTNPATQCAGSCTTSPCYQVVDVGGFGYGSYGGILVTGGSGPDGIVCAYVTGTLKTTSTVNNQSTEFSTPIQVCGTSN